MAGEPLDETNWLFRSMFKKGQNLNQKQMCTSFSLSLKTCKYCVCTYAYLQSHFAYQIVYFGVLRGIYLDIHGHVNIGQSKNTWFNTIQSTNPNVEGH